MDKIPTAEEFIRKELYVSKGEDNISLEAGDVLEEIGRLAEKMDEYANLKTKFHVQAALKAAFNKAKIVHDPDPQPFGGPFVWVDEESILSAYPLDKIK